MTPTATTRLSSRLLSLRGTVTVIRSALVRRPGRTDVPAVVAAAAMLTWAGLVIGPWTLIAALGMLAAAITPWQWPGTAAGLLIALAPLAEGPTAAHALVSGLLVAGYLVLLDGPPRGAGATAMAAGVGLATLVAVGAIAVAERPGLGWMLAAALAAPLALLLASSGHPRRKGPGDE